MVNSEATIARLQERLQVLEDKEGLRSLLHAYCLRPDNYGFEGYANTFTEDGSMEFEKWPKVVGREAITKASSVERRFQGLQHTMTNLEFSITGPDTAIGTSYLWFAATPDVSKPEIHYAFGGPYTFDFKRTSEGWRISRMRLRKIWAQGEDTEKAFGAGS